MRWIYGLVAACFMMLTTGCGNLTKPMDFHFDTQYNVAQNATITSNTITILGNQFAADITIVNGTYSISGGTYTNLPGKIGLNQTLTIQQTSAATTNTATVTTVTVGGYTTTFTSVTSNTLAFQQQTGVDLSTVITSNTLTIPADWASSAISITGGDYSIDGGAYTSSAGTIGPGQTLTVQHTSAATNLATTTTTVTIGSEPAITFTSVTKALTLDFAPQYEVGLSTLIESAPISLSSLAGSTAISITNGQYSYSTDNGTTWSAYTNASGTVLPTYLLKVQQTSSSSNLGQTATTVTVGSASGTFITVTKIGTTTDSSGTISVLSFYPSPTLSGSNTILNLYAKIQNNGSASATATVTWQANDSNNIQIAKGSFTTATITASGQITNTFTGGTLTTTQYNNIASWSVSVKTN